MRPRSGPLGRAMRGDERIGSVHGPDLRLATAGPGPATPLRAPPPLHTPAAWASSARASRAPSSASANRARAAASDASASNRLATATTPRACWSLATRAASARAPSAALAAAAASDARDGALLSRDCGQQAGLLVERDRPPCYGLTKIAAGC